MNRRRFLIAFAVFVPITPFVPAKIAASWRPVMVGKLLGKQTMASCDATSRFVIAGGEVATLFDLKTGEVRLARNEGVIREKSGVWELKNGTPAQLIVRLNDGTQSNYSFPKSSHFYSMNINSGYDLVSVSEHYVDLIFDAKFYRWKRDSHQFVRQLQFKMDDFAWTFGQTGENIIYARRTTNIESVSTTTGHLERAISTGTITGGKDFDDGKISAFGNYIALREYSESSDTPIKWIVASSRSGQGGWGFNESQGYSFISFSPDETLLAVPSLEGEHCEIHDLRNGHILRELPLIPNTNAAAFSPDGATLYSVAGGVLYRQRAR